MKKFAIALIGSLLLANSVVAVESATGKASGACRCAACGEPRSSCVSEPAPKKVDKVTYGSKCVEYCLPKFPGLHRCGSQCADGCKAGACGQCGGAGCGACGKVRTKKVLLKKVTTVEVESCKCVPQADIGK